MSEQPLNTSGIQPLVFNVLVEPDVPPIVSAGGIRFPDEYRDKQTMSATTGTVIAVSATAFTFEHGAEKAEPGDRVAFNRHSGMLVDGNDSKKYFILQDKSIVAVYDPAQKRELDEILADIEQRGGLGKVMEEAMEAIDA